MVLFCLFSFYLFVLCNASSGGHRVAAGVEARPAVRGAVARRRLRPGLREGEVLRPTVGSSN